MSYCSDHYSDLCYPTAGEQDGLFNAQIGAIHAIASHFTVDERPAIVTMPTGSGKTAVLMMAPYLLRCKRALVVTPSRLVRNQIAGEFSSLETLLKAGVLPSTISPPRVIEVESRTGSSERWEELRDFDVVVSTPNCISPGYESIPAPPADLFDLLLIDEAHHAPAPTWTRVLTSFSNTHRILFTATPFRRDRAEIPGRFVYNYPIARAYEDNIFGAIKYVGVEVQSGETNDKAIARRAQQVFLDDQRVGLKHKIMVRTDSQKRAKQLARLYENVTTLRLAVIHSKLSSKTVRRVLARLSEDQLDGIICVNMLGEGFDFPSLKIAAIHSPHKSLEVTLQFVGRFARTKAPNIGEAKFIAVLSEIEIESRRLFDAAAIWQKLIPDLSHGRVAREIRNRESLQSYARLEALEPRFEDLSFYSLNPRRHVKIYRVADQVNLQVPTIALPADTELSLSAINAEEKVLVMVIRQRSSPKWLTGDAIIDQKYELFVVYYDVDSGLLFVNSSRSSEGLYEAIAASLAPGAKPLPTSLVKRVLRGIENQRLFNIGMRNIQATNKAESYRILAGSDTSSVITPADARRYRQGHAYLLGEENGVRTTIGYSSGSKVWSATSQQIPELVDWCRLLGQKIQDSGEFVTHSGLDYLDAGRIVNRIPPEIIYVRWDREAFDFDPAIEISYTKDDGSFYQGQILDLELVVDSNQTNEAGIRVMLSGDGLETVVDFTLDEFYSSPMSDGDRITVTRGSQSFTLIEYLNDCYLEFFTTAGALFRGNEIFEPKHNAQPIDVTQIEVWDWADVDIKAEVSRTSSGLSVHQKVAARLEDSDASVIFSDHGTGEIADFVSIRHSEDVVEFRLYHCKASSEPAAGARVADVYEICGQAQKSIAWTNISRFENRVKRRKGKTVFLRGAEPDLTQLIERAKRTSRRFQVIAVQPGISKARLSDAMAESLGATNSHLVGAGALPIRIITSA